MNAHTRISGKGQVVVPKATRDRLGWSPGLDLDVIEGVDSVTFRRRAATKTLTVIEAVAQLRKIYTHHGAPVPIEDMGRIAAEAAVENYEKTNP